MFRNLFRFFVYSNLFIALCALLMVHQTYCLLLREPTNRDLLGFVCFATFTSYSFHWWLTAGSLLPSDRIQWLIKNRVVHLVLFFVGIAGAAIYFLRLLDFWYWLVVAGIATFLYSAPKIPHPYFRMLRKVAIGKTIFLAFVWMYVTTILPVIISGHEWQIQHTLFVISRFFLVYAICILFDLRDRLDDRASGIRSLITYFDDRGVTIIFIISLVIFVGATCMLLNYGYDFLSILLLLIPGIITAFLYNYARRNFSDMLYYFVLDGLMALSGMLMVVGVC